MLRTVLTLAMTAGLFAPTVGRTATYYVDAATGSDVYTATEAQNPATPWRTISHAAATVPAGAPGNPNVIQVAAGVYDTTNGEAYPIVMSNPDVSLVGAGSASTTIDGDGAVSIVELQAAGLTVQGFTLDDATTAVDAHVGGFMITENVFSNDPDFAIGTGVSYVIDLSSGVDWSAESMSILDNEMNVSADGIFIDLHVGGNSQAVNLGIGSINIEDNVIRLTGTAGGIDINRIAMHDISGASATVGTVTIRLNTVIDGGDGIRFAGSLTGFADCTVAVGAVELIQNSLGSSNGTAILVDHYDVSTWSGSTSGTLGRVLLATNTVYNYVGGAVVISDIGPWQYLSGDASVDFAGVNVANNNNVHDFVSSAITINYNQVSQLSGNASASLGPLAVRDCGSLVASDAGLHVEYANVGYQLTDQATVSLGDVAISSNGFDTYSHCLRFKHSRVGQNMSGTASVTGGDFEISDNFFDAENATAVWLNFQLGGDNLGDSATVEQGNLSFTGNTVIAPTTAGLALDFYQIGSDMAGSSQVTWGEVHIGGPLPTDANTFTTSSGVNLGYDDVAYDMDGFASLEMGDVRFEGNTVSATSSTGVNIELDNYESVGFQLYGDATASMPDFFVVGNTIDAYSQGVEFSGGGHGDFRNRASFHAGGLTIADNVFNSTSSFRGVWYQVDELAGDYVSDTSKLSAGSIIVRSNSFNPTTQDCIAIELPHIAYLQEGSSQVEVGDIAVMDNQIAGARSAIILEIGTYGDETGTATVGQVTVSGNTVDSVASGESAVHLDYYVNPGDSSIATVGRTLVRDNTLTAGSGEYGVRIEVEYDIDPGATGTLGPTTVDLNTIADFAYGVHLTESDDVSVIGNVITGNIHGIWVAADSQGHLVEQNDFLGNSAAAVTNMAATWLHAEDNWWGDDSGPFDSIGSTDVPPCTGTPANESNSDGLGDPVGDRVDYCPWTAEEFEIPMVLIDGFGSGDTSEWSVTVPR